MTKSVWQYYPWYPRDFLSDRSIRKLNGLAIAILRAFHDQLWISEDRQISENDSDIAYLLDLNSDTWLAAKKPLLASGALYREGGYLRSPHIDECWKECEKRSRTNSENRAKALKKQDTE